MTFLRLGGCNGLSNRELCLCLVGFLTSQMGSFPFAGVAVLGRIIYQRSAGS